MKKRSIFTTGISGSAMALSLAIAATPQMAMAQDADEAEEAVDEDGVIIVRGFQAALESAVSEKRNTDLILESVTAEDIGKLPDNSIGEAIARLPGLTAQRLGGRANSISIRGFGQDFSQTLLNGREQTSLGDARAVEFDQYPAELVQQVVVYKTPSAELVGQGLVGTIDIRTLRPLDLDERILAVGARLSYPDTGALNSGSSELGYRVNATFADTFADGTVGISLSASYVDEPYHIEEFNAWGYTDQATPGNRLIGGSKSFVTSTDLERLGLSGTVQVEFTPQLTLTVDGFYSDFEDDQIKRGIELPLGFCVNPADPTNGASAFCFSAAFDPSTAVVENETVVGGTFPSVEGVVRNDIFNKQADLVSGGINLDYEGDDGWNAFIDFGYSRTDRRELSFESYSGTGVGAGNGAVDQITFTQDESGAFFNPSLNYSDPNLIVLTDPLGWGGGTQAGYFNDRIIDDELWQFRVGIEKELDGFISALKLGANFTNREKTLTPDESFIRLAGGALERAIPSELLLDPTDLSYLGLGPIVSYDARELIESGIYVLEPNLSNDIPAKAFNIQEELLTFYGQADIFQRLGNADLTGNIGVQAINTDQRSSGIGFPGGVQTPISAGDSYWDILPSANLSLRFDSDFVIRVAASRQIQRPRLDDLRSAIGYGLNFTGPGPDGSSPFISGGGGNPFLRPYRANAFDMTFEKYFGRGGVIAAQLYYKDIKSYIDKSVFTFDYTGFPLPAGPVPPSRIGLLDAPNNTGGGDFYGAELGATIPFGMFSEALEGFGFTGGVGYTETKVEDAFGNVDEIPGYSKWVANGTAYYERYGFNARASVRHRSGFLGDFTGFGGALNRKNALSETIVDAQIGYDFEGGALDGLSVYLQGQNLTNEPFVAIDGNGNPLQVVDYQSFGRRFLAGFTFRF
ncbi:TonB-dependent receptor [Qipengyuania sp. DSG2-2]|uniref:TonB-dependent receptor n=1 Tax=Qipengyuania sp. DGS2-2 TaxID=3349631 RepID=UPI0036D35DF1